VSAVPTLARWLDEADRILDGAGAGLTAATGFDYGDTAAFRRLFPAFAARGYTAQYQMIGRPLPEPLLWGYWFKHVHHMRFADHGPSVIYGQLKRLTSGKDTCVHTSNVDALFARSGFDPARVYTPQGDYALLQCTLPCTRQVWPVQPLMERGLASLDYATGEVTDPAALPRCPGCGGRAFLNVIGAGFTTPSVVRFPMERIARAFRGARFVRINRDHPGIPADLRNRSLSIAADVSEVLAAAP
jgi:NAD-dependent SIR2 family protein deacetylase